MGHFFLRNAIKSEQIIHVNANFQAGQEKEVFEAGKCRAIRISILVRASLTQLNNLRSH